MNTFEFVIVAISLFVLGLAGVIAIANHYSPRLQKWGKTHISTK